MRISVWSSDVCSSDLRSDRKLGRGRGPGTGAGGGAARPGTDGAIMAGAAPRRARPAYRRTTFRMTLGFPSVEAAQAWPAPLYADLAGDVNVSFEFFPPKSEKMEETLWTAIPPRHARKSVG